MTHLSVRIISALLRRRTRLQQANTLLTAELASARRDVDVVRAAHLARLRACAACPLCAPAGEPIA